MDGHCSGAIIYDYLQGIDYDEGKEFIRWDYNMEFPFDKIIPDEQVYIVDLSLPSIDKWERLLDITSNIIWIDHHKSAIEDYKDITKDLDGIRKVGEAACTLTYNYCYPDQDVPMVVKLIADHDIWVYQYGDTTRWFQSGTKICNTLPGSPIWETWLNPTYYPSNEIAAGKIIEIYRRNMNKSLVSSFSFFTEFEGYRAVCCNAAQVNSTLFDTVTQDFDLMIPFAFNGKTWQVSIYTTKGNIDCSEIAKKYGGGGHKQAAGFVCERLPFSLP